VSIPVNLFKRILGFTHFGQFLSTCLKKLRAPFFALSLLDGHSSRQCPAALELFRAFNIEVLVLPSHCSHILQMFDVGLAAGLKKSLTDYYKRAKKDSHTGITFLGEVPKRRYNAVMAGIRAWNSVASPDNCKLSANLVGLFPYNPEKVLSDRLVIDDSIAERLWPERSRDF
jgi:hypothetical protein